MPQNVQTQEWNISMKSLLPEVDQHHKILKWKTLKQTRHGLALEPYCMAAVHYLESKKSRRLFLNSVFSVSSVANFLFLFRSQTQHIRKNPIRARISGRELAEK